MIIQSTHDKKKNGNKKLRCPPSSILTAENWCDTGFKFKKTLQTSCLHKLM